VVAGVRARLGLCSDEFLFPCDAPPSGSSSPSDPLSPQDRVALSPLGLGSHIIQVIIESPALPRCMRGKISSPRGNVAQLQQIDGWTMNPSNIQDFPAADRDPASERAGVACWAPRSCHISTDMPDLLPVMRDRPPISSGLSDFLSARAEFPPQANWGVPAETLCADPVKRKRGLPN